MTDELIRDLVVTVAFIHDYTDDGDGTPLSRVQMTNGNKFAMHQLVITETAHCSVATRLSPTSTEEKLTGTARTAAPVRFAKNTVTCYSESPNTQKPQNTITL